MAETTDSRAPELSTEAVEFVRFCYARRPVPWPELYDEMTVVAARGLFRGWSYPELADHGIALTLSGMPVLAGIARSIIREASIVSSRSRSRFAFPEAVVAR